MRLILNQSITVVKCPVIRVTLVISCNLDDASIIAYVNIHS